MRFNRFLLRAAVAGGLVLHLGPMTSDATAQQRLIYIDGKRIDADAASLTLIGEDGTSKTLSAEELAALPQKDVSMTDRDSSRSTFRGVSLRALMTLAGAPTGHNLRGPNMLLAVIAEATDGYRIAFMLAELDEQFAGRDAILALIQDGKALPENEGPYRLVVPGETHRARWARQVNRLRLVRVGN